jgi:cell division septum initiation protein DivIVA
MSDFERSGVSYDEPAKRRTAGTWFADLGDRLARGFNNFDRPQHDEDGWGSDHVYEGPYDEPYEEVDQPTAAVETVPWEQERKRFPTSLHGYDREAVDVHLAALEREMADLRAQRMPSPAVEEELERLGEETSAILRVAHEQAAEITRRAQTQADRCVADAAANAVAMTEEAKRKLRQLDTETDAVWAERGRLIEDVRNVATALFSLAEDAADRFPEDGERSGATVAAAPVAPASEQSGAASGPSMPSAPPSGGLVAAVAAAVASTPQTSGPAAASMPPSQAAVSPRPASAPPAVAPSPVPAPGEDPDSAGRPD